MKCKSQKLKLLKYLPWLLCLLILTGCGFKLRGAYQLPDAMQVTYIDAEQVTSSLVRSLTRSFKTSKIQVLDEVSENAAVFKIYAETKNKRIVSVDSRGRAREYTLNYKISFSLKTGMESTDISEQTIGIERDFLFDTEDVLGNSKGESQLYEEMQDDLVRLILLRLQSQAQK